jgi:hypothetical protein
MKKQIVLGFWIVLLLCMVPTSLWAWCWIRDSGTSGANCGIDTVQQDCCDGNLRKWAASSMDYHISSPPSDPITSTLEGYIDNGMDRWTNLVMSDFVFNKIGTTSTVLFADDGTNIVNIDGNFCANTGLPCGTGILGVSGTFTSGSGTSYRATGSDIILNAVDFVWGDGTGGTINTVAVVAHEGGHSAGLSHPGSTCRSAGSSGCGPEFEEATMYWNYSAGENGTDKSNLELDDVAALVYGYPRSSFRVRVLNSNIEPIVGAQVELLDSAAPVNGTSIATGGSVRGDVTNSAVLFGDAASSSTYVDASPFNDTDASGETNYINPVHQIFDVQATAGSNIGTETDYSVTLDATSTLEITLTTTETDFAGPTVTVTSHSTGDSVGTAYIILSGTANDDQRGDSGVSQVTVNGVAATGTTSWSSDLTLSEGTNTITIVAADGSAQSNTTTQNIDITYDTIPPTVITVSPTNGQTDVEIHTTITAHFSEVFDATTVTTSTFSVDNGVGGAVSTHSGSTVARLTPSADLDYNTTYTVTLTTGIQDAVGNAMAGDYVWSFTTRSRPDGSGGGGSSGCFIDVVAGP